MFPFAFISDEDGLTLLHASAYNGRVPKQTEGSILCEHWSIIEYISDIINSKLHRKMVSQYIHPLSAVSSPSKLPFKH